MKIKVAILESVDENNTVGTLKTWYLILNIEYQIYNI